MFISLKYASNSIQVSVKQFNKKIASYIQNGDKNIYYVRKSEGNRASRSCRWGVPYSFFRELATLVPSELYQQPFTPRANVAGCAPKEMDFGAVELCTQAKIRKLDVQLRNTQKNIRWLYVPMDYHSRSAVKVRMTGIPSGEAASLRPFQLAGFQK